MSVLASGRFLKRWKMKKPSFRLEILRSPAQKTALLEDVELRRGSDATALEKPAGLEMLEAVIRPVVEQSSRERSWGLWSQEAMILLVQEKDFELEGRVWRGEGLERGNIWAFWPPSSGDMGKNPLQKVKAWTQEKEWSAWVGKCKRENG